MKKMTIKMDEIALSTRRTWGDIRPYSRIHKTKKTYNRKDHSWRREED